MCKTRILSQTSTTFVSTCVNCQLVNIWHNNLLLNFNNSEFLSFTKSLNALTFEGNALPFPDDVERVVLRTPHTDISFTFEEEDFDEFKRTVGEAIYMIEVYTLMNKTC